MIENIDTVIDLRFIFRCNAGNEDDDELDCIVV